MFRGGIEVADIECAESQKLGPQEHVRASEAALCAGLTLIARTEALAGLKLAEAQNDRMLQAQSLLCLAQCDRAVGRLRRAQDSAQQSIQLFRLLGDVNGEINALALLSHCCSLLGRDEEAVEASLLGLRLAELLGTSNQVAVCQNYLGVAYTWSGNFAQAEAAYGESIRLTTQSEGPGRALQPMFNLSWVEVIRLLRERYFVGRLGSVQSLLIRVSDSAESMRSPPLTPMLPDGQFALHGLVKLTDALAKCWAGETASAWTVLNTLDADAVGDASGVMPAMCGVVDSWVRAELHWAAMEFPMAETFARTVIVRATDAGWEQMAYVGHLVLAQIFEKQDKCDEALNEHRELRRREQRVRGEGLESRQRVVQMQLDVRASEKNLAHMVVHSQELERLSFEDTLTGLPNRRRFDLELSKLLSTSFDADCPHCVALIDLDKFKRINDQYTHLVGDEVLKAVAGVLRQSVRHSDLPVRLAGDEFVILFPRTKLDMAEQVCARIRHAVANLEVAAHDDVVRVTVSIGVAESIAGDTPSEALRRADIAMFADK